MGDVTRIEWTDRTFNPWWGCARVSPACRHCYADSTASRWGHELWRRKGPRRMLSESNWNGPVKWNREAERAGAPAKVFCASMADVFEIHPVAEVNAQLDAARSRLWALIERTPWLIWQLLTKRPENVGELAPWGSAWPRNVWIGTSVENQDWAARRIPVLLEIPAVRFLSCEPLLGPIDVSRWVHQPGCDTGATGSQAGLGWVIVGGESGHGARPMRLEWARQLRDQCTAAGVPFFFKQAGAVLAREWGCASRKGEDPAEWLVPLPREFPTVAASTVSASTVERS